MAESGVHRWVAALALAAAVAGCSEGSPTAAILEDGTVFLALAQRPTGVMDALFQGRVVRDAAGCLRLEGPDASTVVWPFGSRLTAAGEVRLEDGRVAGRIGGAFRLGGGHVGELHAGIALSEATRALAHERCPGDYWIVGDVPAP